MLNRVLMNKKEILSRLQKTESYLDKNNITDAYNELLSILNSFPNAELRRNLDKQMETYRYMVQYMLTGSEDNMRFEIRDSIIDEYRSLTDKLKISLNSKDSDDIYSETLRNVEYSNLSFPLLIENYISAVSEYNLIESGNNSTEEIRKKIEDIENDIFNCILVSYEDKTVIDNIITFINKNENADGLSSLIINAMILSCLNYYDRYKLKALLDLYENMDNERMRGRALAGIVMILSVHGKRVTGNKEIRLRLEMMKNNLLCYRQLNEVVIDIIRTRDTKRINEKMEKEVIPELMKLRPDMIKGLYDKETDLESALESNPEWEEKFEQSGLGEKLRELSELQEEGADLMMLTFANLKQFPFFNKIYNWFLPFTTDHSILQSDTSSKEILSRLMEISTGICDSDKYSLALALDRMPDSQKGMMYAQLEAQSEQIKEIIKEKELKTPTPKFDEEVLRTVRDFYRFYKLYRRHKDFKDIFESPFNFISIPILGEILSDEETLKIVGEFYFRRGYYAEALSFLQSLAEDDKGDVSLLEKIGYCYEELKFFEKSIEIYSQAELIKEPSRWLLNHLAYVNRSVGNYENALHYYKTLLDSDSENIRLIKNCGYMLLTMGEYDEALSYFYHAHYIDNMDNDVLSSIALCEFKKKNYLKSHQYYLRIEQNKITENDSLNIAHIELLTGNTQKAVELYKELYLKNKETFAQKFRKDLKMLESHGYDIRNAEIILDYLRM